MKLHPLPRYSGRLQFTCDVIGDRAVSFLDVGNLGDGESANLRIKEYTEAKGGTYYGLDSNEELTNELNLPNQLIGDIHGTDLDPDQFDIVYLGEVIEHTWTPGDMVSECYRLLKPGGQLVLDTPNPYSLRPLLQYLFRRRDSMKDIRKLTYEEARDAFSGLIEKGESLHQPQHKLFFTPAMLKQMFETHGFVVESVGFTNKPRSILHKLLLWMFPHTGSHLCVVGRKATVDEAFADVANATV